MRLIISVVLAISVLITLVAAVRAQENKITVSGQVTDMSGAVVSGAKIMVSVEKCKCSDCPHPERCDCCPDQFITQTNESGQYSFTVPHGIYRIDVGAGDRKAHVELNLNNGSTTTQDIRVE